MFAALDGVELVPSPEALAESRAELRAIGWLWRRREPLAAPSRAARSFWDKIREGFTIHFHFAPGIAQVAGAAAMLVLGFLTARVAPNSFLGQLAFGRNGGASHLARSIRGAGVAGAGADRSG